VSGLHEKLSVPCKMAAKFDPRYNLSHSFKSYNICIGTALAEADTQSDGRDNHGGNGSKRYFILRHLSTRMSEFTFYNHLLSI